VLKEKTEKIFINDNSKKGNFLLSFLLPMVTARQPYLLVKELAMGPGNQKKNKKE
jgi:hypothetical protein